MNRIQKTIIVTNVVVIVLMGGCKELAEKVAGNGNLRYHWECVAVPGDYQTIDGQWAFTITGTKKKGFSVSASGTAKWVELADFSNCSWRAEANGAVTVTGVLKNNCELEFDITITWENPALISQNCPYTLDPPTFDSNRQSEVIGPFPLHWGAKIVVASPFPDYICGGYYVLEDVYVDEDATDCKVY